LKHPHSLLRLLKVAKNKLTLLPASAARLRLQEVDLSDNNFDFKVVP
jgi:Leucine-rich repeat (LRR) protein